MFEFKFIFTEQLDKNQYFLQWYLTVVQPSTMKNTLPKVTSKLDNVSVIVHFCVFFLTPPMHLVILRCHGWLAIAARTFRERNNTMFL